MISALSICGYAVVFGLVMYVILDGFTVGIGVMLPWFSRSTQNTLMSSILPTWDSNQTWLVFVVAALYGAFPLAFSTLLPHWYLPLFFTAMALLARGIAFEFRMKEKRHAPYWDGVLGLASLCIPIFQAYMIVDWLGVHTGQGVYATIILALVLLSSYVTLGASRMLFKCQAEQQPLFRALVAKGWAAMMGTLALWLMVVPTLPALRGLSYTILGWAAIAWLLLFATVRCLLKKQAKIIPYFMVILALAVHVVLVWLAQRGMAIPALGMTAEQAAAPPSTLSFLAPGLLLLLPMVLVYTSSSYWVFRGRVREDIHY